MTLSIIIFSLKESRWSPVERLPWVVLFHLVCFILIDPNSTGLVSQVTSDVGLEAAISVVTLRQVNK